MKLVQLSSSQARASRFRVHSGGPSCILRPPSAFSFPKVVYLKSRSLSGIKSTHLPSCSFPRALSNWAYRGEGILPRNEHPINCVVISAISNACMTRFCGTCHKAVASLSRSKIHRIGTLSTISIRTSTAISPVPPLIVRPPSSIVLVANVTPPYAPQRSEEWFALRRDKLTTSTFSTALGFWKGNRRFELWHEKVFESETETLETSKKCAMEWEGGILEVKCPYNKGKPEMGLPWSTMPFYYMPQVQGQMEIMDREWVDLYCWTPNGSSIFRVSRERGYWELIHRILREFWWENVVPAREAVLMGIEKEAMTYKPASTHKQTGLAIVKSIKLAGEAKLLCKEIAGHVEFYR
ncbi:hypothetical protein CJ030_MR7G017723 [Morella rubra]|uniref:YqaJ viral recombinase domain-containing protein n=1 Tax=Morella rubra TaxID=262757 RepID=A0A6A1V4T1_9ROSI|nr:hypothetical protein CJ030_MR7G017723 [Morella rubra]